MTFELKSQKSILDNIVCIEKVNHLILDKLINSNLLLETFNNPFCQNSFKNEKEQLIKYRRKIIKNNNSTEIKVKYNKVEDMGGYGRVFPEGSIGLYSFRRQIRHTLAKDYYYDLDIKNCHPELLLQLCINNGIGNKLKYLKKYVNKRSEILEMVIESYLSHIDDTHKQRDMAKQLFIRLLYFGKFENWLSDNNLQINESEESEEINKFIFKFYNELKVIGMIIIKDNKHLDELVEKKKAKRDEQLSYNKKGSIVSYYLQEYENQILECIYKYLVSKDIIDKKKPECVLCADGLMILKEGYYHELLGEFEIEIKEKFHFDLKFEMKEMNEDYINKLDDSLVNENITKYYDHVKEDFEANKFKVMNPIAFAEMNNEGKLIIRKKGDFVTAYENIKYLEEVIDKKGNVIESEKKFVFDWIKDETIKTYQKIDFLPMQVAPEGVYNSFQCYEGSKLKLNKDVSVNIVETAIYKHMDNLCNNNFEVLTYFINFMARKLQKPYKLTNSAMVFRSAEGCGKDSFFNWFGNKILGHQYYLNEDKTELIFGKFNSSIENKILIVINETSGKDTFSLVNTIKNAITRPINIIEYKGMTPYDNTNNAGYIFLTNNKGNPIKIDTEDRRFMAVECNNTIANNKTYFDNLYKEFNNVDITKAFYDFFMKVDCDDFNFTNRPETEFYKNLQLSNVPIIAKFLEKELYENEATKPIKEYKLLFGEFLSFLQSGNYKIEFTETKFGIQIKEYKGVFKRHTKKGIVYDISFIELKQYLISKKYIDYVEFMD